MKVHLLPPYSISETSPTSPLRLRTAFLLLFFVNLTFSASAQTKIWDKTLGTEHVFYQDPNGNFYQFGEENLTVLITTPDGG